MASDSPGKTAKSEAAHGLGRPQPCRGDVEIRTKGPESSRNQAQATPPHQPYDHAAAAHRRPGP
ncbi:hypothetical protein ACWD5V_29450 [Streptomyces sp. NPDC002523]